jgi:hypothetical protein
MISSFPPYEEAFDVEIKVPKSEVDSSEKKKYESPLLGAELFGEYKSESPYKTKSAYKTGSDYK